MPAFDASLDYLEMLGLDLSDGFQFAVEDLRQAIRDKRKEWTGQAVNPLYQQQARQNLDLIRGFEKLLTRPEALSDYLKQLEQLHAQRRTVQERQIGNLIRGAIANREHLTTRQRDLLVEQASKVNIGAHIVDGVIDRLGVEVQTPDKLAVGSPKLPYEQPALDKTVLAQVGNWMAILEVSSFYELLDLPVYAPIAAIQSHAEMQFAKWSKVLPKSTEVTAWEKTLQACLTWLKDEDSREQYNRALFNQRIDQFVQRIDLVLAGGQITRDDQIDLTRIGTREFGLSSSAVSRCIQARVIAMGVPLEKPVAVTVQMQGQTQCMRCYVWSPRQNVRCWNCGGSLAKRCANPFCKQRVAAASRACDHCDLRIAHGRRFAALISMGDSALARVDWETARSAYRTARRILSHPEIDERIRKTGRIRGLIAKASEKIAASALSSAREVLAQLVEIAPEMDVAGLPTLEELSLQIRRMMGHCKSTQAIIDPIEAADMWSQILDRWSDCQVAYQSLRILCDSLARDGHVSEALQYGQMLIVINPKDDVLRKWIIKVRHWQSENATTHTQDVAETDSTDELREDDDDGNGAEKLRPANGHGSSSHTNGNSHSNGATNGTQNALPTKIQRLVIDRTTLATKHN